MQIKVEHTKTHTIDKYLPDTLKQEVKSKLESQVLVADAELVLVECNREDALLGYSKHSGYVIKDKNIFVPEKWLKPILISETEKEILDGEQFYDSELGFILTMTPAKQALDFQYKILALPEHFSPQQLQMIIDGKLKEGKCMVECATYTTGTEQNPQRIVERKDTNGNGFFVGEYDYIKLNPYITIYPVEGESVYDQLSDLHDWICDKIESISQKEIDSDAFQLGRCRAYQAVLQQIKSYPVEEKMVPISLLEKAFNDSRKYGYSQSEKRPAYDSFKEWFNKNVK